MTYEESALLPQFITSCKYFMGNLENSNVGYCKKKEHNCGISSCDNCPLNGGVK